MRAIRGCKKKARLQKAGLPIDGNGAWLQATILRTGGSIQVGFGSCFVGGALAADLPAAPALGRFEFTQTEMAVPIRIVLYAPDNATAADAARGAFRRFHELNSVCSDYDSASEVRQLCANSSPGKSNK